jgi:hypothetical protein
MPAAMEGVFAGEAGEAGEAGAVKKTGLAGGVWRLRGRHHQAEAEAVNGEEG